MRYRIYPAIGISRLGEEDDFFIGPEVPGKGPTERGTGAPVTRFKSAGRDKVRKQAARFHLFESEDGASWKPARLPEGATVSWTVALENRKSAVERPADPPIAPQRPRIDPSLASMHIRAPTAEVSGPDATGTPLVGTFSVVSDGNVFTRAVTLGRLKTDNESRLLVLGGKGTSEAPPGTSIGGSFYRNPRWYDDVSDGPVSATVKTANGTETVAEGGAWVIVAPPDYAPEIDGVVTLFDVIRQVGVDDLGFAPPTGPFSFDLDIAPMIRRVRRLRWTNDTFADWSDPRLDDPALRSRSSEHEALRRDVRNLIVGVEKKLRGHVHGDGPAFRLRAIQNAMLDAWVKGQVDDGARAWPEAPSAEGLTRASLEGAVGQGLCPGIEAGIIVLDPSIYVRPFDFRIDHAALHPGDLTALMAQPWQADFLKCNTDWWPSQRPDIVAFSADLEDTRAWNRGATSHAKLVANSARLGFIVRSGADEVFVEAERDPTLAG